MENNTIMWVKCLMKRDMDLVESIFILVIFMKVSFRKAFIMDMVDLCTKMVIIIKVFGKMTNLMEMAN